MAELKVGRELKRLGHRNITPRLEHHHGNWATRQAITDDKFGDDVQADLLIGDGLNHSDGDDVEEG